MCGLVAVVSKLANGFSKKQEDVFYQMLYADVLRGDDSTGVIGVENTGGFHIAKEAVEATWFIPQIKTHELGRAMFRHGKMLIGHNRKATVGKVKDETAHPFVVDNTFAMVHNGTLYGHKNLHDTDVDSEALAKTIKPVIDDKEKLEEVLGKIYGAYAVMAYDQNTHKAHFLRNKERPLSFVELDDCWIFASEGYMLGWIASRNGYDLSKKVINSLTEHHLLTISLSDNIVSVEKLEPKKATPHVSHSHKDMADTGARSTTASKQISQNNSTFEEGGVLSKNEFKRLRKKYLYTRQEFWALDYVEKNFPRRVEDGETEVCILGESDDLNYECTISASVDLSALGIPCPDIGKYVNETKWVGFVEDMSFDRKSGSLTFHLSKAKPIGLAIEKNVHEATPTVH